MNRDLLEKIKILNKGLETEALEELLGIQLKKCPRDIELWFKLAIVELIPPLADYYKSLDCLNKVLEYDKNNPYALLLQAYMLGYICSLRAKTIAGGFMKSINFGSFVVRL